jgi:hypothetical protein
VAARSPDDLVFPSPLGGYQATLALDRYGHLFADELVDAAAHLGNAMRSPTDPTLFGNEGQEA